MALRLARAVSRRRLVSRRLRQSRQLQRDVDLRRGRSRRQRLRLLARCRHHPCDGREHGGGRRGPHTRCAPGALSHSVPVGDWSSSRFTHWTCAGGQSCRSTRKGRYCEPDRDRNRLEGQASRIGPDRSSWRRAPKCSDGIDNDGDGRVELDDARLRRRSQHSHRVTVPARAAKLRVNAGLPRRATYQGPLCGQADLRRLTATNRTLVLINLCFTSSTSSRGTGGRLRGRPRAAGRVLQGEIGY